MYFDLTTISLSCRSASSCFGVICVFFCQRWIKPVRFRSVTSSGTSLVFWKLNYCTPACSYRLFVHMLPHALYRLICSCQRDSSQNPLQRAAADNQESPGGNDSQHHHLEPVNPYTGARHPQLADSPSHATAAANDQSDASGFHASTDYYVSFNTTENTPMTSTPMSSNASILGGSLQQQHEALPPAQPHAGVNRRINGSSVDWDSSQANSNNPTPDFAASGDSQNRPGPTDRSILAQRLQAQGQPPSRDGSTRSILSAGDSSVSRLNDISSTIRVGRNAATPCGYFFSAFCLLWGNVAALTSTC